MSKVRNDAVRHRNSCLDFARSLSLAGCVWFIASPAFAGDIQYSAQADIGGTVNFDSPNDKKNFGRLFDDKSNQVLLNQILLTAQKPIDPATKGYDFGFKLQGLYGSDARYTHSLKEFQNSTGDSTNQIDLTEANVQVHTPWFTNGGFDIKAGEYPSPQSAESIDPSSNFLYSHSYIFNFGVPFKHVGVMTTLHATPQIDIYLGGDTGVNTFVGDGDNNDALSFFGGIGLNLNGGKWTTLATTHIGPEIADKAKQNGLIAASVDTNNDKRALSTITSTWKVSDKWTLINDMSWVHDDAVNAGQSANAFGMAQYGVYAINDHLSLVGRGEIFRDVNGSFVSQSGNNIDYANGEAGIPARSSRTVGGGKTTYGAVTLGMNIKPDMGIKGLNTFTIRLEVRYDTSLNATKPFNDSSEGHMLTAGVDLVIGF